jgi:hypothetical protein
LIAITSALDNQLGKRSLPAAGATDSYHGRPHAQGADHAWSRVCAIVWVPESQSWVLIGGLIHEYAQVA